MLRQKSNLLENTPLHDVVEPQIRSGAAIVP
jgi:hypothetical protein